MTQDWSTSGPDLHLALAPRGTRHGALEDALRAAVRDGRLAAGTRLPSTRALAGDLGLSRGTVVEAFAQLTAEGYLDARHGAGTWVAELAPAEVRRSPAPERAGRAARFDFVPGVPDLTSFPQAAWMRSLRQGLRGLPAASFGYGDPRGRPDLREQLAGYLARARGVRADPELVILCAGFRHGLSLVARVLQFAGARSIAPSRLPPASHSHGCLSTSAGRAPTCSGTASPPPCSRRRISSRSASSCIATGGRRPSPGRGRPAA